MVNLHYRKIAIYLLKVYTNEHENRLNFMYCYIPLSYLLFMQFALVERFLNFKRHWQLTRLISFTLNHVENFKIRKQLSEHSKRF